MTEIWDLVDENGIDLGVRWPRSDHNKMPEGCYHPCVEVWVKAGDRLLVTQRHPNKSDGLKYDLPGGAVLSGEGVLPGALRELYEEVGIYASSENLTLLGKQSFGKVFAVSYLLSLDDLPPLTLQQSEVVGYRLVTKDEFERMVDTLTKGTYRRYLLYKDKIF